ncbi:MAG: TIGR00730 family Rossman fold protein [Hyphomicrobiaceae bacterium]
MQNRNDENPKLGPSGSNSVRKPLPERNVCVFCGSGPGRNPAYVEAARAFGTGLAENGIGLVYGGGSLGLMGEIARSVLQSGGYATGIIPEFLTEKEHMLRDVDELIVTRNMHERKQRMFERSDAFVALPGGIGTLEELIEQMTWAQLGQHDKPVVIANVSNFWAPLKGLLDHMRQEAFIRPGLEVRISIVDDIEDVIPLLADAFSLGTGDEGNEGLIEKL